MTIAGKPGPGKLSLAVLLLAWTARGLPQQAEPEQPSYTFHVSSDLLQVPVLVLSENKGPLPPIDPSRFMISVAGGKYFHPQVRREGDDRIALAVLLDNGGTQPALLTRFAAAEPSLSAALHPADILAIDRLDRCLLRPVLQPTHVTATTDLRAATSAMEKPTAIEEEQERAKCKNTVKLWDGMVVASAALARQPGRRVLLVVTDGHDKGGSGAWDRLHQFAATHGVSIFAISDPKANWRARFPFGREHSPRADNDDLSQLCELTGGIVLDSETGDLGAVLGKFVPTLRERYVVEFPRPERLRGGSSSLEVHIAGVHALIYSAGVSFPKLESSDASGRISTKALPRPVAGDRLDPSK